MATKVEQQPHFILFPFLAQGHMLPMLDMARLFAQRGVIVTIVTTPHNAMRFKSVMDRAALPIRLLELPFRWAEVGLPEGCENVDTIHTMDMIRNFNIAIDMLQEPLEQSIQEMEPRPICIISDAFLPWTSETARKFDIPRLLFHGISCFSLVCNHNIQLHKTHERVLSESEPFVIPGLADRIEMTKETLPMEFNDPPPGMKDHRHKTLEAELTAYGVVVNSFESLESEYAQEYRKIKSNKAWCIGPVSLCNKEELDKAERGNKASIDDHECLKWLDAREPGSVVYVCLGSQGNLILPQLIEIGLGLEASKSPFIWVIRKSSSDSELEKWLSEEEFEERTKGRGLIIKGWAPQVLILSHQAIGGFFTHCGWNSTLEGVCAGVPLITSPMFAEQFLNEKLVVEVLGIGVKVGVQNSRRWGPPEGKPEVMVKKEDVEKAVNDVMDRGEVGEIRRKKARELGQMASSAMEEGGSSYLDMTLFIQDIMHLASKKVPI